MNRSPFLEGKGGWLVASGECPVRLAAMNEPDESAQNEDPLVLAMPRRELFRFSGFSTAIDLDLIDSIAGESWYAAASTLVGSLEAKEVRLGLLCERGDEVLVDAAGSLLHSTRVGPEIGRLGHGIKALRDLALLAGARFLAVERVRCELVGFLNEEVISGYRGALLLVYRCRAGDQASTPPGMTWVHRRQLAQWALDPVAVMIAAQLYAPPPAARENP